MRGPESKARKGVGKLSFRVTVPCIEGVTQSHWKDFIELAIQETASLPHIDGPFKIAWWEGKLSSVRVGLLRKGQ